MVRPGARLIAEGTADKPIVFTSSRPPGERRAGDWGGVLLLGQAPTNAHDPDGKPTSGHVEGLTARGSFGGDRIDDDSGVMRWVRIEYSGVAIGPNNEINGLTLAGVGRGTVIDHVAVRHTVDDCFEFFGGTVDAHHLLCQSAGDDAFDWDLGYTGRLQFLIALDMSEVSGAHGIEGDSQASALATTPRSAPTVFNATLCSPVTEFAGERYGVLARNGTAGQIHNALIIGFDAGLDVRGRMTALSLDHLVFGGQRIGAVAYAETSPEAGGAVEDDDEGFDELAVYSANNLVDPKGLPECTGAGPRPFAAAELHADALAPPDDGFFDPTARFVGAIRDSDDNWLVPTWVGD